MSTMLLIGRTPAACSRACIQAGDGADRARRRRRRRSAGTAPASSIVMSMSPSRRTRRRQLDERPAGPDARAVAVDAPDAAAAGRYAVATSRAMPMTLRQSGRLAVTSKSMHRRRRRRARSMPSTSKPRMRQRRGDLFARRRDVDELAQPGQQDLHSDQSGELLQEPQVVLVEQPDVVDLYCSIAMRSMPMPNAKPVTVSGS